MSVIEKLDSVLALVGKAAPGEWTPHPTMDYSICLQDGSFIDITRHRAFSEVAERDAIIATLNLLRDHGPAIRQAMIDARRLDWLGDEGADRQCFIGMDGRWTVQDGFSMWGGGTLREAIDAARATGEGEGHD